MLVFLLLACADPPTQTQSCADYVACLEKRDAVLGIQTNMDRFRADGDCWGGIEAGAELCDRACTNGMVWLLDVEPSLRELCTP
ncbi:MAG TPA: hypothetical protein PKY30_18650 [Myxococcota bacterium]|nr:hypothetical protein [Myxococcota bacterium]HNH49072.1 hypothetical protein [Myxococcota bacterium]